VGTDYGMSTQRPAVVLKGCLKQDLAPHCGGGAKPQRRTMEILTVKEVSEILKSSQGFIYKHYKSLGGFKIAGLVRFNKKDFENKIGGQKDDSVPAQRDLDV
jgi:hypothetical protein